MKQIIQSIGFALFMAIILLLAAGLTSCSSPEDKKVKARVHLMYKSAIDYKLKPFDQVLIRYVDPFCKPGDIVIMDNNNYIIEDMETVQYSSQYGVDLEEDSILLWRGDTLMARLSCNQIGALDSVFAQDPNNN